MHDIFYPLEFYKKNSKFLETYGVAIFTLVLIAILIAFAGPLETKIKEYTLAKAEQTNSIGSYEIENAGKSEDERLPVNDFLYAKLCTDEELILSANEITTEKAIQKDYGEVQLSETSAPAWKTDASSIKTVNIQTKIKPSSCYQFFSNCSNLTEIKNIENLRTLSCTTMFQMFFYCQKLTSINVSEFDTRNVTNLSYMFYNCSTVTTLNVNNWNTSNVTNMSYMFNNCKSLTSLDVSNWNSSKVTNIVSMFANCSTLRNINMSGFDTSNVTKMNGAFMNCSSLTTLDVSNWNTSNVTNMTNMFNQCTSLTALDVSKLDTTSLEDAQYLFSDCKKIKTLDVSKWNVSKVKNMSGKNLTVSSTQDVKNKLYNEKSGALGSKDYTAKISNWIITE